MWEKYHRDAPIGECFTCKESMKFNDAWHTGHVEPQSLGGSDTLPNLRPICAACNTSMGTMNMNTYKEQFYADRWQ